MQLIRRSLLYVMIACLASLLSGCNEASPTIIYKLTLSEHSVAFDMNGGIEQLNVSPFPEDEPWEASYGDEQDWFTFEASATSLSVEALPNHSTTSRYGSIILTSPYGNFEPFEVSVVQESAPALEFSTTAKDSSFDSEGGEYTFTVSSNYEWSAESSEQWLTVQEVNGLLKISAGANDTEENRSATVTISAAEGSLERQIQFQVVQGTRNDNPYFKLVGKWEIKASKWFYSPNGSLNNLDYDPSPTEYYLIFDIEEGEYGKTLVMKNFLYPNTSLEVRYEDGDIIIPFGWTVYSYTTFLYITLVSDRQFSYASLEVKGTPTEDYASIALDLPEVEGFNYVGFGLWTYDDNGGKVAVGSQYRPTMFPMGPITFNKYIL